MYFSLITPVPGREREAAHAWARSAGPYVEHQWLWRFFPAEAGSPRDFLFRRRDADGLPRFYVVSQRPPVPAADAWLIHPRDYAPVLEIGDRLQFELRANPVVTHSRTGKRTRHDVVIEAKKTLLVERGLNKWEDWKPDRIQPDGSPDPRPELYELVQEHAGSLLSDRAPLRGFAVDQKCLAVEAYQQHGSKKEGQLRISTVDFSGELTVTDPNLFGKTLREGIGHAKAFGCGLLLVRRV